MSTNSILPPNIFGEILERAVVYNGQTNDKGEPHGYGVKKVDLDQIPVIGLSGSSTYEGQFVDGKYHGYGIKTGNLDNIFAGQWVNNAFTGWGKNTLHSEMEYEGNFLNGELNGVGRLRLIRKDPSPGGITTTIDPTFEDWGNWNMGNRDVNAVPTDDKIKEAETELEKTKTELEKTLDIVNNAPPPLDRKPLVPLQGSATSLPGAQTERRLGGRKRSSKKRNGKKKRKSSKK